MTPDLTDSEVAAILYEAKSHPELAVIAETCRDAMEWAAPDGLPDVADLNPWDRDALIESARAKIEEARR